MRARATEIADRRRSFSAVTGLLRPVLKGLIRVIINVLSAIRSVVMEGGGIRENTVFIFSGESLRGNETNERV